MQTIDRKFEELNKLNASQRKTMKKLWNGRELFRVYVDATVWSSTIVKVCDAENFWLIAELGPKGAIKQKRFERL
jgi:hypothetical protein